MTVRSKIKPEITITDKLLDASAWVFLLVIWVFTVLNYSSLPETIPIHYNAAGIPDGFGSRNTIFTLPAIATIILIALTILNNFPHLFNYPTRITEENALVQYTHATRLIRYLKIAVILIFGMIVLKTVYNAMRGTEGLGAWFLPVTMGSILIPLIYFIFQSLRARSPVR